ncbi:MAG: hypothetical protein AAF826_13430 [Pseudomonadota bacterium]
MENTLKICGVVFASFISILGAAWAEDEPQLPSDKNNDSAVFRNVSDTACGYSLTAEQRFELIKEGFSMMDANNLGFNFFQRFDYVYPDKIYVTKRSDTTRQYRVVYLSKPSIRKAYQGKDLICAGVLAFEARATPDDLEYLSISQVFFVEDQGN